LAEVHVTKQVNTPPDELWAKIGDFHRLGGWVPNIPPSEAVNEGKARKFDVGGTPLIEELVDEGPHFYSYRIDDGPLPVQNYRATLKVAPEGDGSLVTWDATFEPRGVAEDQAVAIITGIFQSGLSRL
jgi:hypothetical protein